MTGYSGYFVARLDDGSVEIRNGGGTGGLTLAQAFTRAQLLAGWRTNPVLDTKAPGKKSLRELGW